MAKDDEIYDESVSSTVLHCNGVAGNDETEPANITIDLLDLCINTNYYVCSDEIKNGKDKDKVWILESSKKYYHWLKERKKDKKPQIIPVVITSKKKLKLEASFTKVGDGAIDKKYLKIFVGGKELEGEFEITENGDTFSAKFTSTEAPFSDTVQYIPESIIKFSYNNCETQAKVAFYITWQEPLYSMFDKEKQSTNYGMQIIYEGKKCILETLLHLACSLGTIWEYNSTLGDAGNRDNLIERMFEKIKTREVIRVCDFEDEKKIREKEKGDKLSKKIKKLSLGYWRGQSGVEFSSNFEKNASLRFLFRHREARCPHWKDLLLHLAYVHGIGSGLKAYSIMAYVKENIAFAEKLDSTKLKITETLTETIASTEIPGRIKRIINRLILNGSASKTAEVVVFDKKKKVLVEYSDKDYVDAVFLVKNWNMDVNPPVDVSAAAQGNTEPLNFFWDHVLTILETSDGKFKYFDPSYGQCSQTSYATESLLFEKYCLDNLSGILKACVPDPVKSPEKARSIAFKEKHSKEYAELFYPYVFYKAKENVFEYLVEVEKIDGDASYAVNNLIRNTY